MTPHKPSLADHEVIICTRNRPDDLRRALASVAASSHEIGVLVVDSSDDQRALTVVSELQDTDGGSSLRVMTADPGLTLQRNVGLEHSDARIVHFIDDDSEVFPDYFARIARLFDDPGVVGAGGVQDHIPPRRSSLPRRLGQVEARPGRISASAVNNLVTQLHSEPQEVDWLSGCCMAFRADRARHVRFNERLSGYSLGEDVDFSLRIGRFGRLLVDTTARVHHNLSPVNRSEIRTNVRDTLRHRRRLVGEYPDRFSVAAFWWSVVVDGSRYTVSSLRGRSASRQALMGLLDAARDPQGSAP